MSQQLAQQSSYTETSVYNEISLCNPSIKETSTVERLKTMMETKGGELDYRLQRCHRSIIESTKPHDRHVTVCVCVCVCIATRLHTLRVVAGVFVHVLPCKHDICHRKPHNGPSHRSSSMADVTCPLCQMRNKRYETYLRWKEARLGLSSFSFEGIVCKIKVQKELMWENFETFEMLSYI